MSDSTVERFVERREECWAIRFRSQHSQIEEILEAFGTKSYTVDVGEDGTATLTLRLREHMAERFEASAVVIHHNDFIVLSTDPSFFCGYGSATKIVPLEQFRSKWQPDQRP